MRILKVVIADLVMSLLTRTGWAHNRSLHTISLGPTTEFTM